CGLSTTVSISLGCAFVAGKKRVPSPAAGRTALRSRRAVALFVCVGSAIGSLAWTYFFFAAFLSFPSLEDDSFEAPSLLAESFSLLTVSFVSFPGLSALSPSAPVFFPPLCVRYHPAPST